MIGRIDQFLIRLAGKIIAIAAFFGVERKTLIFCWGWLSPLIFFEPEIQQRVFTIIIWIIMGLTNTMSLNRYYRDDDILPSKYFLESPTSRTFWFFLFLAGSCYHPWDDAQIFMTFYLPIKLAVPHGMLVYFYLNQTPKNPLRLRNLIRNMFVVRSASAQLSPVRIDS